MNLKFFKKIMYKILPYLLLLITFPIISLKIFSEASTDNLKIPAFPGAQGFGSDTAGGRRGKVIEVTNLEDSGPGSLRVALTAKGPRIVTFRISGTITLSEPIWIDNPYITIAGQTAPGDGICIKGSQIIIRTHDVVIRFIRSRPGDGKIGFDPGNRDALSIEEFTAEKDQKIYTTAYNIIIDHCSFSWAIDGNIDILGMWTRNITIQNSIISESLNNSTHPKGAHGTALLIASGVRNVSIHHNIFAHNMARIPLIKSLTSVVFANNIIYNWDKAWGAATLILPVVYPPHYAPAYIDIVNNFYKPGNDSGRTCIAISAKMPAGTKLYVSGNTGPAYPQSKNFTENWKMVEIYKWLEENVQKETQSYNSFENKFKSLEPWNKEFSDFGEADEVYESVLKDAGATLPKLDEVDKRIIEDVRNRTGKIINSQDEVGGWPELRSIEPPKDTDHDGMPDNWELNHGLNPNNPEDGNADKDKNGYTNIEEYLNELASKQT